MKRVRSASGRRTIMALLAGCLLAIAGVGVPPAPARAQAAGAETGLPLPRFVSLRAREANLRRGPGVRYQVDWVYTRRFLPLEILAEFENWRKVRDWEGTEGWMHESMLSGRRTVMVTGEIRGLRGEPQDSAPAVAFAEPGVIGALLECRDDWCRIDAQGHKGWLRRAEFFGAYPGEPVE